MLSDRNRHVPAETRSSVVACILVIESNGFASMVSGQTISTLLEKCFGQSDFCKFQTKDNVVIDKSRTIEPGTKRKGRCSLPGQGRLTSEEIAM